VRDGIEARRAETRYPASGIQGARRSQTRPFTLLYAAQTGRLALKAEEHTQRVGAIVTNLQALETVLRYFLAKLRNEAVEFPKAGDQTVKFSYLTRRTSLGKLIRTFNEVLAEAEKKFEVDIGIVHIRDAIAHGRLVTTTELPFRLWKRRRHARRHRAGEAQLIQGDRQRLGARGENSGRAETRMSISNFPRNLPAIGSKTRPI
jgi:hypothetical protein